MALPNCLPITIEQIRARIKINSYTIETPYVKSFNINQPRSSLCNTFTANVEIPSNADLGDVGNGMIEIFSGTKENYLDRKRFTGRIKQIGISPVFGKPNYMNLNISGTDILYKLENKVYSRRLPTEEGVFATIEGSKGEGPA
jgi:hypothetical protein